MKVGNFQNVFKTIKQNELTEYEVIYIDSNSTDDSIERTRKFNGVKIFQITGYCNAAIARNIGAKEASGDVLFFIDGDNEIIPEFLLGVYNETEGLLLSFVSGQLVFYNYTIDWKLADKTYYFRNLVKDKVMTFTAGGIFLIKKEIWYQVGGMKNALDINEDIDLGLRLAKLGFYLVRKIEVISIHHTIPYNDFRRRWKSLLKGDEMYRGVLMRNNFFNTFQWRLFLRENYSVIALIMITILIGITGIIYSIWIYIIINIARTIRNNKNEKILNVLIFGFSLYVLRDVFIILGFLFFYKKEPEIPFYFKLKNSSLDNNKKETLMPNKNSH
jgi:glycosyltransferase involved in cell wall biosynthesis